MKKLKSILAISLCSIGILSLSVLSAVTIYSEEEQTLIAEEKKNDDAVALAKTVDDETETETESETETEEVWEVEMVPAVGPEYQE